MAIDEGMSPQDAKKEKQRLADERKKLKAEQKQQKKDAKARAKEIASQEASLIEEDEGSNGSVFMVTFVIVLIWVAILCLIVKLDFGGFGSNVLTPVLKDVPVLNLILPKSTEVIVVDEEGEEAYGGYNNLQEAVDYIKELELELERAKSAETDSSDEVTQLKAEIERLKTFEDSQVEFQRIKTEFYEEVVYADKGPGIEEYQKYYEAMDPATAEYLYKQVVTQLEESDEIKNYAKAYSEMKPKEAAAIFEAMTDNLDLAARILGVMEADDRGKILGVMDSEIAARITKIMDPES